MRQKRCPPGCRGKGFTMQEFGKRIGWARGGLIVSAVLLAVMGVLCFTAHGILPEALHNPQLPEGYTWPMGELIAAVIMAITGVCQLAAYNMAGASKNLGGWLVLPGVMSLVSCAACLLDPVLGTFSFEWVIAVFIAFVGLAAALGALVSGRTIGYKGWVLELILGLVMVVLALGVVYNSAYASTMAGIAFIVYAVIVILVPFLGNDIKLKA